MKKKLIVSFFLIVMQGVYPSNQLVKFLQKAKYSLQSMIKNATNSINLFAGRYNLPAYNNGLLPQDRLVFGDNSNRNLLVDTVLKKERNNTDEKINTDAKTENNAASNPKNILKNGIGFANNKNTIYQQVFDKAAQANRYTTKNKEWIKQLKEVDRKKWLAEYNEKAKERQLDAERKKEKKEWLQNKNFGFQSIDAYIAYKLRFLDNLDKDGVGVIQAYNQINIMEIDWVIAGKRISDVDKEGLSNIKEKLEFLNLVLGGVQEIFNLLLRTFQGTKLPELNDLCKEVANDLQSIDKEITRYIHDHILKVSYSTVSKVDGDKKKFEDYQVWVKRLQKLIDRFIDRLIDVWIAHKLRLLDNLNKDGVGVIQAYNQVNIIEIDEVIARKDEVIAGKIVSDADEQGLKNIKEKLEFLNLALQGVQGIESPKLNDLCKEVINDLQSIDKEITRYIYDSILEFSHSTVSKVDGDKKKFEDYQVWVKRIQKLSDRVIDAYIAFKLRLCDNLNQDDVFVIYTYNEINIIEIDELIAGKRISDVDKKGLKNIKEKLKFLNLALWEVQGIKSPKLNDLCKEVINDLQSIDKEITRYIYDSILEFSHSTVSKVDGDKKKFEDYQVWVKRLQKLIDRVLSK
jgi:hypothetical protein